MSQFATVVQDLHQSSRGFEKLRENLSDELIEEACAQHDISDNRRRRLPHVKTVWLVVGMALLRSESIQQVVKSFKLFSGRPPSSGSISEARKRLGADALRWLFRKLGSLWCRELNAQKWRGLTLYGIDGSVLTLEDTKANVADFGKPGSRSDKSPAARPQARAVGLMELTTKMMVDAEVVPLEKGENTAVLPLLKRISANSLTIMDRGFQSRRNFFNITSVEENRHFICRVKNTFKPKWVRDVTPCSWIGQVDFTQAERSDDPRLPPSMLVRLVEYKIVGAKDSIRIATSLLDNTTHPALDLARLYHLRWEFELGLRNLKVTLLDCKANIRSKNPQGVRQEIWAIFLAYNLVCFEAATVANQHDTSPSRISFKTALISVANFFRIFASGYADLGDVPAGIQEMRDWIWQKRLPERQPERVCPRWVKHKQPSKFPKNPSKRLGV